ncbi:Uncharacterized protein DUF1284, possibly iron-sulphur binding [Olavius algarvensis associated proteobacterium Delta 3]|nr:Uncharacterized protein DUF1284, possibly iron-sulphur binding [Olavius algarvensis associated proteobacterium Delta 3]CAB5165812.1 Uncharacterized protein DUF1284, possibly iron-sulphur binding [Olavius algarvensis associated proteobacterium Delta 3]
MANDFATALKEAAPELLSFDELKTLQVNLGDRCNLSCRHCHVNAGPNGEKVMSREIMDRVLAVLGKHPGLTLDITGGSPEMNPNFKYLIDSARPTVDRLMVRSNICVLLEPGYEWIPQWYADQGIILIGSLPCYTAENVARQRGPGVFEKSVTALQMLNRLGYGKELELNLVYNPGADFLPVHQRKLEADYKRELYEKYGITFSNLFTITNVPIGRFGEKLKKQGRLDAYIDLLRGNLNMTAASNIMCRTLISVDYEGLLYNCDFNQALGLPILDTEFKPVRIENIESVTNGHPIITASHCFSCTAGAGSSCIGALDKDATCSIDRSPAISQRIE